MKGIVFTELIEMVESDLGLEISDKMIQGANTSNDGSYTAVGTYDHNELIQLVLSLSETTGSTCSRSRADVWSSSLQSLPNPLPQFFEGVTSAIEFLPLVETYIHVEVRKLYPDAELPSFDCQECDGSLEMTYRSNRPFADLAEGLIRACVEHFQDAVDVSRTDLGEQDGTSARFLLTPSSTPVASGKALRHVRNRNPQAKI